MWARQAGCTLGLGGARIASAFPPSVFLPSFLSPPSPVGKQLLAELLVGPRPAAAYVYRRSLPWGSPGFLSGLKGWRVCANSWWLRLAGTSSFLLQNFNGSAGRVERSGLCLNGASLGPLVASPRKVWSTTSLYTTRSVRYGAKCKVAPGSDSFLLSPYDFESPERGLRIPSFLWGWPGAAQIRVRNCKLALIWRVM